MHIELLVAKKLLIALLVSFFPLAAQSEPAAWYWWASKLDGARFCLQTSPGNGWYRDGGPYRNSRCSNSLPR